MGELRWNPLLETWTMVAANRQHRPNLSGGQCPFCPGSGKVPLDYEVLAYENDYPALEPHPGFVDPGSPLYPREKNLGKCEVILYSPDHEASLASLSLGHIEMIAALWQERYTELSNDEKHRYIHIFENKGTVVGVTQHHPHGQLYAYPFIPLKIEKELASSLAYFRQHHRMLLQDILEEELRDGRRIIYENESFVAFIPYFTDYPYGLFILPRDNFPDIRHFSPRHRTDLADVLKRVVIAFDALFEQAFPYMMSMHQAPVNAPDYREAANYYKFHIEFYPPLRAPDTVKYYASSETGAWAAANTRLVEETAMELRALIPADDELA